MLLAKARVTLPHHALHLEGLVDEAANQLNKLEDDHGGLLLIRRRPGFGTALVQERCLLQESRPFCCVATWAWARLTYVCPAWLG
jgi:hypothetical protein